MSVFVPRELFTCKTKSVLGKDAYPAIEFPDAQLVIIISRIALDITVDMEFVIKLFEEHAFDKGPPRRVLDRIHLPSFRHNAVLDDAGVTDKRVNSIRGHHVHRVARFDGRGSMLHLFWQAAKTSATNSAMTIFLDLYILYNIEDTSHVASFS